MLKLLSTILNAALVVLRVVVVVVGLQCKPEVPKLSLPFLPFIRIAIHVPPLICQ